MLDIEHFTFFQFSTVMVLVILIIALAMKIVNFHYKLNKYRIVHIMMSLVMITQVLSLFIVFVKFEATFYWALFQVSTILYLLLFLALCYRICRANNRIISIMLIVLSSVLLAIIIYYNTKLIVLIPIATSISYLILYNYIINVVLGTGIVFDVEQIILDSVVIVNQDGNVIFVSEAYKNSDVFNYKESFDTNDLEQFFKVPILEETHLDINYIKVKSQEINYYRYYRKEILNNEKIVGYIITFSDITYLMNTLFELDERLEEIGDLNRQLLRAKKEIESSYKEKETLLLLEEIASHHTKSIKKIVKSLGQVDINGPNIQQELETILDVTKINLSDVRNTVSIYYNNRGR